MSYDIYIGEYDDNEKCVQSLDLSEAPAFDGDEMTGHGNHRHPGYGQWTDWARDVGLYPLFFDKTDGLMREHPGNQSLSEKHLDVAQSALRKWKRQHKDVVPGWGYGQDAMLARLVWLEWWMVWALKNCKRPTIYNH